jgi:hypothetical protein
VKFVFRKLFPEGHTGIICYGYKAILVWMPNNKSQISNNNQLSKPQAAIWILEFWDYLVFVFWDLRFQGDYV